MATQDVLYWCFGRPLLRSLGEIFRFGIDVSILNSFAVGTSSWLSGRGRGRNGAKKSAVEHWFAKESRGAARHGALASVRQIVAGDNDDRERGIFQGEMRLHVEPVHLRHVQIENDAIREPRIERLQKLRTGGECLRTQAGGTHQPHQRFADRFFVVNDSYVRLSFGHNSATVRQPRQPALLDLGLLYLRLLYLRLVYFRLLYFSLVYFSLV